MIELGVLVVLCVVWGAIVFYATKRIIKNSEKEKLLFYPKHRYLDELGLYDIEKHNTKA